MLDIQNRKGAKLCESLILKIGLQSTALQDENDDPVESFQLGISIENNMSNLFKGMLHFIQ